MAIATWGCESTNCRRCRRADTIRNGGFRQTTCIGGPSLFRRLLLIALLLEIGLVLLLVPWSRFWERNYFADLVPAVHFVITNNYVRGAVSGLGLVNIWFALAELSTLLIRRDPEPLAPGSDA